MKITDYAESGGRVAEWLQHPLRGLGGVYAIVNTETGRVYIGSTITPFEQRWYMHYQGLIRPWGCAGTSKSLRADWDIAGPDAFDVVALERIADGPTMRRRENEWIAALRSTGHPLYNKPEKKGRLKKVETSGSGDGKR